MVSESTRRGFLRVVASGAALASCSPRLGADGDSTTHANDNPQAIATGIARGAIEAVVRRRARYQLQQTRLVVDYYRIGRKIAYPLPLKEFVIPEVRVPSIANYPWSIWLLWTLEERLDCLGWTAEWLDDREAQQSATADLAALAAWPTYQQYARPDLSSAHAGRILWTAATRWSWLDGELRQDVIDACTRHVEAVAVASDKIYGTVGTKKDILARESPHDLLHNIPLIGTVGAALTATAAGHPQAPSLHARVQTLFGAVLDLRSGGFCEGVAYDGYVLDFIADWLTTRKPSERSAILDHPNLRHYLEQSYMLGAPGALEQVAELGDVEPREMPFHLSAQAKLLGLQHQPERAWLLGKCPLDIFPSAGLASLHDVPEVLPSQAPPAGALDAHYAAVLRSGWESEDLAVAVSCSNSPMGHLQHDSGSLVIGTHGNWLVADPGYQQYVRGEERDFTIGPSAHNVPVIDGLAADRKQPRCLALEVVAPDLHRLTIDLTDCYPAETALKRFVRHVWLSETNLVVVADQIEAEAGRQATYHWHADPKAAWWFEEDWALIMRGDVRLWFTCSGRSLSGADLHRLAGARGQLSVTATLDVVGPPVWWVFALSTSRPRLHVDDEDRAVRLLGRTFQVS